MIGGDVEGEGAELPMEQDTQQQVSHYTAAYIVHVLMIDEEERRKKQARSNKQGNTAHIQLA